MAKGKAKAAEGAAASAATAAEGEGTLRTGAGNGHKHGAAAPAPTPSRPLLQTADGSNAQPLDGAASSAPIVQRLMQQADAQGLQVGDKRFVLAAQVVGAMGSSSRLRRQQ
ncbi:hypothetical protein PINS_up019880 [Pythium insidiosum]|nr:hypothetical protein PINS_up019880 [Pythium insidiosum]